MTADRRRKDILDMLHRASAPVSASALAARLSVSRQVIVGDIALLRAAGAPVFATPRGYVLTEKENSGAPWPAATTPRIWKRSFASWWIMAAPWRM